MTYKNHFKYLLIIIILIGITKINASTIRIDADKRWYVNGSLGTHFSSNGNTQIPSIASKPPLTSEPVYNAGFFYGLNLGYQLHPFRIEGEFAYQNLLMNKINNAIGAGTVTYLKNSYTNLFSMFMNGYYDFKFNNCLPLYPYIGFGAGYVYVKNMVRPNPSIPVSSTLFFTKKEINYPTWGYQGMVGVIYEITNNIHLNLNYKYFSTFNQEATGQTNLGPDRYQTKQKIVTNIVSLGIQYFFI